MLGWFGFWMRRFRGLCLIKPARLLGRDHWVLGNSFPKALVSHKVKIMEVVWQFFSEHNMIVHLNSIFITLIPKFSNTQELNKFRPISCVNILYNILSKIITNCLVEIAPDLISLNQTVFIKGRCIADNYGLVDEIIKGFEQKSTAKHVCIYIAIIKAFDFMHWEAIRITLQGFKNSNHFISLVLDCVTTARFSILVKGEPTIEFRGKRALWQRDPLSPWLFNMFLKIFHKSYTMS